MSSRVTLLALLLITLTTFAPTLGAQEAAPQVPAWGRPDAKVRKLPFSAEDNADGARFVWFNNCLAGMPYQFVPTKDIPASSWYTEIDATTPSGGPRAGDVIWWPSFMATIEGADGPAVTPEGWLEFDNGT